MIKKKQKHGCKYTLISNHIHWNESIWYISIMKGKVVQTPIVVCCNMLQISLVKARSLCPRQPYTETGWEGTGSRTPCWANWATTITHLSDHSKHVSSKSTMTMRIFEIHFDCEIERTIRIQPWLRWRNSSHRPKFLMLHKDIVMMRILCFPGRTLQLWPLTSHKSLAHPIHGMINP